MLKVALALCVVASLVYARPQTELYDSKYDNFDVETLVDNTRLLKAYTKCFLGRGGCTPEGTAFKKVLPEAIETTCSKCNPKQRHLIRTVVKAVQQQLPNEWSELAKQYDAEAKFTVSFGRFLNEAE